MIDKLGAGHYQTNTGCSVVILCLDAPGSKPVIGYVIALDGKACSAQWTKNGKYSEWADSPADLIPVPRKPREVWISEQALSAEEPWCLAVRTLGVTQNPVLFREVIEDEDNA